MKSYLRNSALIGGTLIVLSLASACAPPPPTPADVEMGLNAVTTVESLDTGEIGLAEDSGSSWDRLAFWWHKIQPAPETWDWINADARYNNEPLENILGVLTSQPNVKPWHDAGYTYGPVDVEWNCAAAYISTTLGLPGGRPDGNCIIFNGLDQPVYRNGHINPANQWAYFVYTTTSRYADKVAAWQIYNEDEFVISTTFNYLVPDGPPLSEEIWYYPDPGEFLTAITVAQEVIQATDPQAGWPTPHRR